jgi:hypothetical protein
MKELMFALLAVGSFSAFAGALENKDTGVRVDLELDVLSSTIFMESGSDLVSNKTVIFADVHVGTNTYEYRYLHSRSPLFSVVEGFREGSDKLAFGLGVNYILGAGDVISWTVKLPSRLIKSSRIKKDIKILNAVISTDEVVKVSNKRFVRIAKI